MATTSAITCRGVKYWPFCPLAALATMNSKMASSPTISSASKSHAIQHRGTAHELGPTQSRRGSGLKNPGPAFAGGPQQPIDFAHGSVIAVPREKGCPCRVHFVRQLRHQQLERLLERVFSAVGADDLVESSAPQIPSRCGETRGVWSLG